MCEVDVIQNAFHHGARAYDDKCPAMAAALPHTLTRRYE
jgi:hypothetical protein